MQRILHVIGRMDRAGAETLIMNLYRNIDRTKIQFDFMVFTDSKADYDDEIYQLGGLIYHMPKFTGVNYAFLAYKVNAFFDMHHYDIVHGHIGSIAPMYLAIAKKHGAFTIAHSHSANSSSLIFRTVFMSLAWPVRLIADYFFACSEQAGIDRFGNKIVSSENFRVLNNGIDADRYQYSLERHENMKTKFKLEDKFVVGHVGRFTQAKNHPFLINVFEEIHKKNPASVLVLVGRGEDEKKVQTIVKESNLENCVIFMGVRDDIPDLMNLFDCFVFPSHSEGLGIVAIEAQAAGLPCFVSEGIPCEAIITKHAWQLNLSDGDKVWAKTIINNTRNFQRENSVEAVKNAGYDIKEIACNLENFYTTHKKGNDK